MLDNWFSPIDKTCASHANSFGIITHEDGKDFPLLDNCSVAIIGFADNFSNTIRKTLYQYKNHFTHIQIADLGNFKKQDADFILPAIKELIESNITLVTIGIPWYIMKKIAHLLPSPQRTIVNLANSIGDIDSDDKIEVLGFQRHLCSSHSLSVLEEVSMNSMSLANVRANNSIYEAILSDSIIAHIDGNVLKKSDNKHNLETQSSGLVCEELCQASKTIGKGGQLRLLNVCDNYSSTGQIESTSIAESIWYALEGFSQRSQDHPLIEQNHQKYLVQHIDLDESITFLKHEQTGKWWIEVNSGERYVSCSYDEYLKISNGELPDRIIKHLAM